MQLFHGSTCRQLQSRHNPLLQLSEAGEVKKCRRVLVSDQAPNVAKFLENLKLLLSQKVIGICMSIEGKVLGKRDEIRCVESDKKGS